MAARAEQDVPPRFAPVTAARARIVRYPTGRVRVTSRSGQRAHAALQMARVARFRGMTARASCRVGLGFDRVAHDEISPVHQRTLYFFGLAALNAEILARVVAVTALLLGMTRLTELAIFERELTMMTRELRVVPKERARRSAGQICAGMAGSAGAALPLLFVLVARKTARHGRQGRAARFHHARMARHALAADFFHAQVLRMIEANFISYRARLLQNPCHVRQIAAMTGCA